MVHSKINVNVLCWGGVAFNSLGVGKIVFNFDLATVLPVFTYSLKYFSTEEFVM